MIVPMLKYTFIAYHLDYEKFLDDIRNIGVLDIVEKITDPGSEIKEKLDQLKTVNQVYQFLEKLKINAETEIKEFEAEILVKSAEKDHHINHKKIPEIYSENEALYKQKLTEIKTRFYQEKFSNKDFQKPALSGSEIVTKILEYRDRKDALIQHDNILNKAIKNVSPWGEFSIETIKKLEENNVKIQLFISSEKKFDEQWLEKYDITVINTISPFVYFAVVNTTGEKIELDAEEIRIPEESISQLEDKKLDHFVQITEIEQELNFIALNYLVEVLNYALQLEEKVDYQKVLKNTENAVEDNVRIIEAYSPKNEVDQLNEYLKEQCIVYFVEKPKQEDKVPIKQKNNRFAKLYEPIGKLFSLPAYSELDLTPFFAPFFMMFFGFCLGDVGYGIVILLGTTLYKIKAEPDIKPILSLAQFLGIGTIIFGILTGTFFGINLINVEFLGKFRNIMLDSQKTFYLALAIGLFQILFGLIIKTVNSFRMFGWQYALPSIGWFILILCLLDLFLLEFVTSVTLYLSFVALALIVFWSDPKAGILGRIGKGIWDLYGITGIFGDVLSYIRLFALGISSAILGFVINTIALQILGSAPVIGPIMFVVFLIIGHAANLMISSLGSFVHPMRLTFVEFYKNAGFIGGGKEYKPFRNKLLIKKENNL
ncbi:MAG: V-type H+-transporting ATPase subunit [Prolixibacteraceae bacterium]|nr:MAG: V-type H+-transporting ATPase subunit [Prolixibacteraceae bacterium]